MWLLLHLLFSLKETMEKYNALVKISFDELKTDKCVLQQFFSHR